MLDKRSKKYYITYMESNRTYNIRSYGKIIKTINTMVVITKTGGKTHFATENSSRTPCGCRVAGKVNSLKEVTCDKCLQEQKEHDA